MREDEPPEEESDAMKGIRAWRATERKKMIESMEKLLAQAQKLATSQYTRSSERSKWTRLAGQLLWYKDQILRAMTWEALEQDFQKLARDVYEDRNKRQAPTWQRIEPAPFVPTLVKKKRDDEEIESAPSDTIPEMMREEVAVDKASSEADPVVSRDLEKKKEDQETTTSSDSDTSSKNPVAG